MKASKDNLMLRTRATVCILNTGMSERTKLFAFLRLHHPEYSMEKCLRLANEAYPLGRR